MNEKNLQQFTKLPELVLELIKTSSHFKIRLINIFPLMNSDIESASINVNCSCKNRVLNHVASNHEVIGSLVYAFSKESDENHDLVHKFYETLNLTRETISGKVAKTTVKDWPEFVKNLKVSNYSFSHMSTSIVGDDVYVFFV